MNRSWFIWNEESIPDTSRARIRQVLLQDWDPIGIRDMPEAANEYDSYIPRVHHLLQSDAPIAEIQDYLFEIVSDRMGLAPPLQLEQMKSAAEALKRLSL